MRRYLVFLICVVILAAGVSPAMGADPANPAPAPGPVVIPAYNYLVAKFGGYIPTSSDLSGYDTGFISEIAYGRYFNPYLAIELGAGYFQTTGNVTVVYPGNLYPGNDKIEVVPLTASLKVSIPVNIWMEPYAIVGTGVYFVHDYINVSNYYGQSLSDNDTTIGVNVGGGINFNIRPNFIIGAECQYIWLDPSLYGTNVNLSGVRITGNFGFRF
ncbi:MAG TPA: outer membrane beta-barrel protein [Smithella sp.]|nr:outer membrane beta-barrel protein [Smithella sp.]